MDRSNLETIIIFATRNILVWGGGLQYRGDRCIYLYQSWGEEGGNMLFRWFPIPWKRRVFLKIQKGLDLEDHLLWSSIIVMGKIKTVYSCGTIYTLWNSEAINQLNYFIWYAGRKNVYDCLFKESKQKFHHKNVYTMSQMISVLNFSYKVNVISATSELHYDWDRYFDRLYTRPAAGTIDKNRIFWAD